jgi:hypothetical protein
VQEISGEIMTLANFNSIPAASLEPRTRWTSAAPLWAGFAQDNKLPELERPAILRFSSDEFMDEFKSILEQNPDKLHDQIADPRRYLEPSDLHGVTPKTLENLKLYQPTHGHFYLVTASLTCRKAGLPDRAVNPSTEKVGFVLRRLKPGSAMQEMAWVTGSDGKKIWSAISSGTETQMASHEEMFAMFPLTYCDHGQRRRVWAGLIPTSSRETFNASGLIPASDSVLPDDEALKNDFVKKLSLDFLTSQLEKFDLETLKKLDELNARVLKRLNTIQEKTTPFLDNAETEAGTFLLLDLADWFEQTIPEAWNVLKSDTAPSNSFLNLYNHLEQPLKDYLGKDFTWRQALLEVKSKAASIYGEGADDTKAVGFNLRFAAPILDLLKADILELLNNPAVQKTSSSASSQTIPVPAFSKFDAIGKEEIPKYVLRCAYLRPHCYPWSHELLSAASQVFTIAAFFDADAPVRPVRITLPDTSLANLRKFKKGVSFSISKTLRQQMDSVSNAKNALKGEISSGQPFEFGMICSLSIPIITICAFVVLMIFLILLNMVFWWLPFFRICFPISKPK